MKRLSSKHHGIVDYFLIAILSIAPSIFDFQEKEAVFSYTLAAVYLAMTLMTDFESGFVRILPFQIHGAIEFSGSLALVLIAFIFRGSADLPAFYFYLCFSAIHFFMAIISNYSIIPRESIK